MKIEVRKLEKPFVLFAGTSMKWEVAGPGTNDRQVFITKKNATDYARIRRSSDNQKQAIATYANTYF